MQIAGLWYISRLKSAKWPRESLCVKEKELMNWVFRQGNKFIG